MEEKKKGKGFSVTALVLGIVGIVLSIILIGGILGIIGTILGIIAIIKSKPKNKMAIAGVILSIIAIIIAVGMIYLFTRDTTAPEIKQKADTFYIGDIITAENLVTVTDIDSIGNKVEKDIKVELGEIDTATEGKKQIQVIATDKAKNQTKAEITVNIVNPNMTIYDYIQNNIKRSGYYVYTIENYGNNHLSIKNTTKDGDYGITDFTEMTIKEYSELSSFKFIDIMKFNSNLEITEIHRTSSFLGRVTNEYLDLNSDTAESTITVQKTHFKDILGKLQSSNINITGKTVEQLKNETIDIRELQ